MFWYRAATNVYARLASMLEMSVLCAGTKSSTKQRSSRPKLSQPLSVRESDSEGYLRTELTVLISIVLTPPVLVSIHDIVSIRLYR